MTEDELLQEYQDFLEKYDPEIYEATPENRKLVELIDPNLVWTLHSTCEDDQLSTGFLEFNPNNCCWREQAWYVSKTSWTDETETIKMSASLPCPECNKDGEGEGDENCEVCDSYGYYSFYVD